MPRGSRHLDEPTLYIHPETGRQRTATTKVEAVSYEADGYRPAAEVQEAEEVKEVEEVEEPSEAAKKAATTRRRNAPAADATATQTTEPNSGSGE